MILLGSTGSIGRNALCVAKAFNIPVETLVAGYNIKLLNHQIQMFSPRFVVVAEQSLVDDVQGDHLEAVFVGKEGILKAILESHSSFLLNALSGFLGFEPTFYAMSLNKTIALANKESLVVGGTWLECQKIIPVDSEHFSLWFLQNENQAIRELVLTASGGALRDIPINLLQFQKAKDTLRHPNWAMGQKITIDSATMANKLFEVLEAHWLFGAKHINAFIERNSLIHALIGFYDGSFSAHVAKNDMRLPIAYALLGKDAFKHEHQQCAPLFEPLQLSALPAFKFEEINLSRYPLWKLKQQLLQNPQLGVVVNAANEVAVWAYLKDMIPFTKIASIVFDSLNKFSSLSFSLDLIPEIDKNVRLFAKQALY